MYICIGTFVIVKPVNWANLESNLEYALAADGEEKKNVQYNLVRS